jgi:superfamily I DNA and RNA helicase
LINEGRDVELDVTAGSEVPIIEDGAGITATNREKGNDKPLVTELRMQNLMFLREERRLLLSRTAPVLRQPATRG